MYYYTRHIHVCFRVYIFNAIFLFCLLERLRSIVMSTFVCVCVCLSVCLRGYLQKHSRRSLPNFVCMLRIAVAQTSSGVVVIRYVLPVL